VREDNRWCMNFDAIMCLLPGCQGAGGESRALLRQETEGRIGLCIVRDLRFQVAGPMHPLASGMEKMVRKKLLRIT
jgi:hypothetical protein